MLQAGATEVCITPPLGVELAGYGPSRERRSTDIHDHLMAQALVLADEQRKLALITSDLIGIAPAIVQQIRAEVAAQTDIPAEHVMISAAHIHTAPTAAHFREWGERDHDYVKMVVRHLVGAVGSAAAKLQPACLGSATGEHTELAWNRIARSEVDYSLGVLRVDTVDGAPLAMLVNYACHPVMLGIRSEISADYPGALRRYLQTQYPGGVIMFANGPCGDIDPSSNSTAWGSATFDDVDAAGAALGADAWTAAQQITCQADVALTVRHEPASLYYTVPTVEALDEGIARCHAIIAEGGPSEKFGSLAEAGDVERRMPEFWLRYYQDMRERVAAGRQADHVTADLQAFIFGEQLAMVALPAEVFTEQGQNIRATASFEQTMLFSMTNGIYGYLPPRYDIEQGGYATKVAAAVYDHPPYRADVTERLEAAANRLLAQK